MNSPVEAVAFPRGVSNVAKYEDKNTIYTKKKGVTVPINSRAALLYNHYLKEYNVSNKYQSINSGDKMLFVYLKMPNSIRENVIGFVDILPEEFGLHKYVDYELQFEKTFLSVLDPILEKIGWSVNQEEHLDDFFS